MPIIIVQNLAGLRRDLPDDAAAYCSALTASTLIARAVNIAIAIDNDAANRERSIVESGERVKLRIDPAIGRGRQFIDCATSIHAIGKIPAKPCCTV